MMSKVKMASSELVELEEKLVKLVRILDEENNQIGKTPLSEDIDCLAKCSLAGSEMGVWCLNEKTGQLYFTRAWDKFLGYPKEQIPVFTISSFSQTAHPEDKEKFDNFVLQIQSSEHAKENYELFLRVKHKENGWGGILIRGKVLLREEDGTPKWSFGTYIDLTNLMAEELQKKDFFSMMTSLHKNLPGFVYKYQRNTNNEWFFPYMSENVLEIFGISPEEGKTNPHAFFNLIHEEDAEHVRESINEALRSQTLWKKNYRINHPTKGIRWIETHATPQLEEDGSVFAYGYAYDATELHQVRESAFLANKFYENTSDGVLLVDHTGKISRINPAISHITGYSEKDLIGQNPTILSSGENDQAFFKNVFEVIKADGYWQGEILNKKKSGQIYTSLLTIEVVQDIENNRLKNYIATFTDISELKEQQHELTRLTKHDYLTNLPNRRLLLEKLEEALVEAQANSSKVVVCFIDLDEFKPINDKYGHDMGDSFLCAISTELVHSVRAKDTVARLGGDEFVVVLKDIQDEVELNSFIDRLNNVCTKTYNIYNNQITLSASMGVVVYPNVKGNADELLRFADQSMYKAKQQGRKRFVFFDSAKEDASIAHYLKLEQVRAALENNEMTLWYQPKVDMATDKVLGVEALIRWQKPDGKIVPAIDFINIIEGDILDYHVGKFVLDRALQDQKRWREKGHDITVSVNISPDHLLHPMFEEDLKHVINKYDANPKLIIIEILETSRISDFEVVIARLKSCLKLGVCFSLDDFGTGYSSLGYLRALPIQEVKIDKSFVFSMLKESQDKMIVQGIIDLSHALGLVVVAEGVETDPHVSELKKMGADFIQGYGVSKPMPEVQLLPWIENWESKK